MLKSFIYEEGGELFDTLDEELAHEKNANIGYKCVTNDLNELMAFYEKDLNNLPLMIHAIQWGQENNLVIPTLFNLERTVKYNNRITREFYDFYESFIDRCWSNLW